MKRVLALFLCILLALGVTACGDPSVSGGKIKIITTIFPVYDWTRAVVGDSDNVEITMLIDNGADLHNFQPTADDIVKIYTCDMFVFVGGESDKWVNDALEQRQNGSMAVLDLLGVLGSGKTVEEVKEGMEAEEEEEDEDEGEGPEYDEHIWLSVKNAVILTNCICDTLCKVDPDNSGKYKENCRAYTDKLDELDKEYLTSLAYFNNRTLVFGDRFPFRYLVDDYYLDYYAAFVGCSAESEASFKTIVFLANKMDELNLKAIIKIEGSDGKLAKAIVENTKSKNAKILTLDSMQSVTAKDVEKGASYLEICKKNLEVLKEAL